MDDRDDLAVTLDEVARLDGRRVAHLSALAAASAADAGCDPASTKLVPAYRQARTVPTSVDNSCAVRPSSETVGRPPSDPPSPVSPALRSTSTMPPRPWP